MKKKLDIVTIGWARGANFENITIYIIYCVFLLNIVTLGIKYVTFRLTFEMLLYEVACC